MQRVHLAKDKWDETVPDELTRHWKLICADLVDNLPHLEIPRHYLYGSTITDPPLMSEAVAEEFHLLGFSDASERAFAAVVYIAAMNNSSTVVSLVTSKTRVSPSKQQSLPRLELCGAVLLAELMDAVSKALKIKFKSKRYWSDSTITLAWIKCEPTRWKTYVANRVAKIQQLTNPKEWNFVPGTDNPADCASRGISPADLIDHPLWWSEPKFIQNQVDLMQYNELPLEIHYDCEANKESKQVKKVCHIATSTWPSDILKRFSTLTKLKRVTAYLFRFPKFALSKTEFSLKGTPLTAAELRSSLDVWIRLVQFSAFESEIRSIKDGKLVHRKSHILNLNPFIDSRGILRVGGRLKHANLPDGTKNPILLPRKSHLTYLINHKAHHSSLHAGPQHMMSVIRQDFWS